MANDDNLDNLIEEKEQEPKAKKPFKPVKRQVPLVEGINTPKTTSDVIVVRSRFGNGQKLEASPQPQPAPEPRLLPDSVISRVSRKNHHIGRWLLIGLISLLLIGGAYEGFLWYTQKQILPLPSYGPHLSPYLQGNDVSSTPVSDLNSSTSTSSIVSLPGGQATTTPTTTPVTRLKVNNTSVGFLNVRTSPSSSAAVITKVHPGETYVYTSVQNGWYEIILNDGSSGWVSGQYVTVMN